MRTLFLVSNTSYILKKISKVQFSHILRKLNVKENKKIQNLSLVASQYYIKWWTIFFYTNGPN